MINPKCITEAKFQRQVVNYLTKQGIYFIKTVLCNRRGIPDLIMCINGKFIAIELKSPMRKAKATPLQIHEINRIQKAGGLAFVINDMLELQSIVHQARRHEDI